MIKLQIWLPSAWMVLTSEGIASFRNHTLLTIWGGLHVIELQAWLPSAGVVFTGEGIASFRNDTFPPLILFTVVETVETMAESLRHSDSLMATNWYVLLQSFPLTRELELNTLFVEIAVESLYNRWRRGATPSLFVWESWRKQEIVWGGMRAIKL